MPQIVRFIKEVTLSGLANPRQEHVLNSAGPQWSSDWQPGWSLDGRRRHGPPDVNMAYAMRNRIKADRMLAWVPTSPEYDFLAALVKALFARMV